MLLPVAMKKYITMVSVSTKTKIASKENCAWLAPKNWISKKTIAPLIEKLIKLIREKIKFRNILISDDLSMKSLKGNIKENTIKTFNAGCNIALHCNGNIKEMNIIGKNSPLLNKFILKKTSQFYKILS